MAQPPLSKAIRQLEEELGVVLLTRTSRVVRLTAAGSVFADEARTVLAGLDRAVAVARGCGDAQTTLRMGVAPHLAIGRFLQVVGAIEQGSEGMKLEVSHLPAVEQQRRLREGGLDLGVFHASARVPDLDFEALFPGESLVAFIRRDDVLVNRSVLTPADLASKPLVLYSRDYDPALHDELLLRLKDSGYRFEHVRESSSGDARDLMLAIAVGTGVGIAGRSLADLTGAGSLVVWRPLEPTVVLPDIVLAWRSHPAGHLRTRLEPIRSRIQALRRSS